MAQTDIRQTGLHGYKLYTTYNGSTDYHSFTNVCPPFINTNTKSYTHYKNVSGTGSSNLSFTEYYAGDSWTIPVTLPLRQGALPSVAIKAGTFPQFNLLDTLTSLDDTRTLWRFRQANADFYSKIDLQYRKEGASSWITVKTYNASDFKDGVIPSRFLILVQGGGGGGGGSLGPSSGAGGGGGGVPAGVVEWPLTHGDGTTFTQYLYMYPAYKGQPNINTSSGQPDTMGEHSFVCGDSLNKGFSKQYTDFANTYIYATGGGGGGREQNRGLGGIGYTVLASKILTKSGASGGKVDENGNNVQGQTLYSTNNTHHQYGINQNTDNNYLRTGGSKDRYGGGGGASFSANGGSSGNKNVPSAGAGGGGENWLSGYRQWGGFGYIKIYY